jgi:predicted nucleic acid-binding Zn ribbon protein
VSGAGSREDAPGSRAPRAPGRTAGEFEPLGKLMDDLPGGVPGTASAPAPGRGARAARAGGAPGGVKPADAVAALTAAWPQVVGEEVAANSQPVQLKQGRLVVAVSSPAWAQTLQFLETTIAAGLNQRLGGAAVERVSFRHAGWLEKPHPPVSAQVPPRPGDGVLRQVAPSGPEARQPSAPHLTPEQQAALKSIEEMGLDPQLAKQIVAAMRAAFVRDQQDSVRS